MRAKGKGIERGAVDCTFEVGIRVEMDCDEVSRENEREYIEEGEPVSAL